MIKQSVLAHDELQDAVPLSRPQPAERQEIIAKALQKAESSYFAPVSYGYQEIPVTAIDHTLLIYRVDNGRLLADLAERTENMEVLSRIRDNPEAFETQSFLHRLLLSKARDPGGPIFDELAREAIQTEPLLVDCNGVVINGNRRLAAMRTLHAIDASKYASFATVSAAVLPEDISPRDVEFTESALQLAPETKLGYGWIERRLKLQHQIEQLKLPESWIVKAYRLQDAGQISAELAELSLVEEYLCGFVAAPKQYSQVADAEELFRGLQNQLTTLSDPLERIWRGLGFALIAARNQLEPGFDRHFPFADPAPKTMPHWAIKALVHGNRSDPDIAPSYSENDAITIVEMEAIARMIERSRNDPAAASDVAHTLSELRRIHGERRAPHRMLHRMREARQMMDKLDPTRLTPEQKSRLRGDVAAIHAQAAYLLGENPETRFEQRKTGVLKAVNLLISRIRNS